MISMLKGHVDQIAEDYVILDVNGVGYQAFCSRRSLSQLPAVGEVTRLEIETHVREDHIHLYGFIDSLERDWFRLLTTVQGVGARVCLAILSVLSPDQLVHAIAAQDKVAVSRANGVGPKLAGRIVLELKDKVSQFSLGSAALSHEEMEIESAPVAAAPSKKSRSKKGGAKKASAKKAPSDASQQALETRRKVADDTISALVNLGYGRTEAFGAVSAVLQNETGDVTVEQVIPAALKELSQ